MGNATIGNQPAQPPGRAGRLPVSVLPATSVDDVDAARRLFLAYAESLGFSLCFQGFDREMASFPGDYASGRRGALLLGRVDGVPAGVVALRDLGGGICEMKRLFVSPGARGSGLGRALAAGIVAAGRDLGYTAMRLDTLETMTAAMELYRSLGFRPVANYNDNPLPGAKFFELKPL